MKHRTMSTMMVIHATLSAIVVGMCLAFLPANEARAQTSPSISIEQFGAAGPVYDYATATDSDGNFFVAGRTNGTFPGQSNAGFEDAFVRKYDSAGNQLWTRQVGSAMSEIVNGVAVDRNGNSYVVGVTYGALPGQNSLGGQDSFMVKYDADGNQIWIRQFGASGNDEASGVAVGNSGIFVVGAVRGELPGQISSNSAYYDAYLRKYDENGNELWTRQFGGNLTDMGRAVAVDTNDNAYVAWDMYTSGFEVAVNKYAADGTEVWRFSINATTRSHDIAVDNNEFYVVGSVYSSSVLPGQDRAGGDDAFIYKFDIDGNEAWLHQFGTSTNDFATGIAVRGSDVYVAGYTIGNLPGHTSAGGADGFLRKYDVDGKEIWTSQFGTSKEDLAYGITATSNGANVVGYTTGAFPGYVNLSASDAFGARFIEGDATPPLITSVVTGTLGESGWHVSPVELSWTFHDDQSPVIDTHGCEPVSHSTNTPGITTTCTVTSTAGQTKESATIKIDMNLPSSHVLPLSATTLAADFEVSWAGTDVVSGIGGYTIYVSDNGSPYVPWLTNTSSTSATFTGESGHQYSFLSQARDMAGNVEELKSTAEATTTVSVPPPTCPQAGAWKGYTDQGYAIELVVSDIAQCQVETVEVIADAICSGGRIATIRTKLGAANIVSGHFEKASSQIRVAGEFPSPSEASGTWISSYTDPVIGSCSGSGTWSAAVGIIPPAVSEVRPNQGRVDVPNEIQVIGKNFASGTFVRLGEIALATTYLDPSNLRAQIPVVLSAGTYTLTVTNPDGSTAFLPNAYSAFQVGGDDLYAFDYELWVETGSAQTGSEANLGLVVHRQSGKSVLSDVTVRFYLGDPDAGGTLIGSGSIPLLSPRSSASTSAVAWTPPDDGEYIIYAEIDPDHVVGEVREDNNAVYRTVTTVPSSADQLAPHVDAFGIDDTPLATGGMTVTLNTTASDPQPGSGVVSLLHVEYEYSQAADQWVPLRNSGWVDYATFNSDYAWRLAPSAGVKYLHAWAADGAGNISLFPYKAYVNYIAGTETILPDQGRIYRHPVKAGQQVTVLLDSISGDADLYVWAPDHVTRPPWVSNLSEGMDQVSFVAPVDGTYQVEVYGYSAAEYRLQVEVGAVQALAAQLPASKTADKTVLNRPLVPVASEPGNYIGLPAPPVSYSSQSLFLPSVRK